jgi:hypothetical protein
MTPQPPYASIARLSSQTSATVTGVVSVALPEAASGFGSFDCYRRCLVGAERPLILALYCYRRCLVGAERPLILALYCYRRCLWWARSAPDPGALLLSPLSLVGAERP